MSPARALTSGHPLSSAQRATGRFVPSPGAGPRMERRPRSRVANGETPVARCRRRKGEKAMNGRGWLAWSGLRWLVAASGSALVILAALTAHAQGPAAPTKAYVGLFKDNAVAVIDTATPRVLGTIPVPTGPHGLVLTPDGRKAYVSSDGASTVSVIDTSTDRIVSSIEVGQNPHGLAISPDGRTVLVSGWGSNQAVLIDTTEDKVVGRIPVAQPHNSAIAADGRAYVGSQLQGSTAIVVVDLA